MKSHLGLFAVLLFLLSDCFSKKPDSLYVLQIGNNKINFEWVTQKLTQRKTTYIDSFYFSDSVVMEGGGKLWEDIIVTDTTSFPPEEQRIFNSKDGLTDIILTKDSLYSRQILIDKDSAGFWKKVGFRCRDTVMRVSPITLEEEMDIDTTRDTIYLLHNLGNMSRQQVKELFSHQLYLANTMGRINIDTLDIAFFYDSTVNSVQLTYPQPDIAQINNLTSLPNGAGIHIWAFTVNNPLLSEKRYYLHALITLTK